MNVREGEGHSSLMIALRNRHKSIVESLMLADADVNMTYTKGNTCVHLLAQKGDIEMLQFLISCQKGTFHSTIQLGAKNRHNENALFDSLHCPQFLNFLIETMKAVCPTTELNRLLTSTNAVGYNLFHKCAEVGNVESLSILTKHISDTSVVYDLINEKDNCLGNTPLHLAVLHGHAPLVDILARSNDVNINTQNKNNDTPLHLALKNRLYDMVWSLMEEGRAVVTLENNDGETCVTIANQLASSTEVEAPIPNDLMDMIQLCESINGQFLSASSRGSIVLPRHSVSGKHQKTTPDASKRRSIAMFKERMKSSRQSITADVRKLFLRANQ